LLRSLNIALAITPSWIRREEREGRGQKGVEVKEGRRERR